MSANLHAALTHARCRCCCCRSCAVATAIYKTNRASAAFNLDPTDQRGESGTGKRLTGRPESKFNLQIGAQYFSAIAVTTLPQSMQRQAIFLRHSAHAA